jgi:hypothetical protein
MKHSPNKGSFKKGQVDTRRNTSGQISKEGVALAALLKKYLVEEASKPPRWGSGHATNAQALAAEIWDQAICGKFPYVQFLADRIMGKVKDEVAITEDGQTARFTYGREEARVEVVHIGEASKPALLAKTE